jgi:hypothetical protein
LISGKKSFFGKCPPLQEEKRKRSHNIIISVADEKRAIKDTPITSIYL